MWNQTFSIADLPSLVVLTFIEILLSMDNAIVLGVLTSHLQKHLRSKALYIGVISAFAFRAIGLIFALTLLRYPFIQLLGATYLLYLCIAHFLQKKKDGVLLPDTKTNFWRTVLLIELFDLAFAVDSIVAGIAFIGAKAQSSLIHPKIWIVYVGGMLGVVGIRYAAHFFSALMGRFPRLHIAAYLMVGWIGIKLAITAVDLDSWIYTPIFWSGISLLLLYGLSKKKNRAQP